MESNLEKRKIELEEDTLNHLDTTRKWSMFIAIMSFIFLSLVIIIGLIAGTFLTAFSSGIKNTGLSEYVILIFFLLLAVLYIFPIIYLFRFSKHASHAIRTYDKLELHKAIKYLKSYFVYIGVFIIVVLSFYILILIFSGTSMSFLKRI